MDSIAGQVVRARSERLVTKTVGDEIVIYDLDTDKAHLLNPASAVLWRLCERGATVGMLRAALDAELNTNGATDELLWTAIDDLSKAGLLETDTSFVGRPSGMTRRSLLKKAGILAIAAPAITTILAPPAAASHTGTGCIQPTISPSNTCGTTGHTCCAGSSCVSGQCCLAQGAACNGELCCNGSTCSSTSGKCCFTTTNGNEACVVGTEEQNNAMCCGTNVCRPQSATGASTSRGCFACVQTGGSTKQASYCCSGTVVDPLVTGNLVCT